MSQGVNPNDKEANVYCSAVLYSVQYSVYSIQCTVYTVKCTVYFLHTGYSIAGSICGDRDIWTNASNKPDMEFGTHFVQKKKKTGLSLGHHNCHLYTPLNRCFQKNSPVNQTKNTNMSWILQQEVNIQQTVHVQNLFYPSEVKFYTYNVCASVTNFMIATDIQMIFQDVFYFQNYLKTKQFK